MILIGINNLFDVGELKMIWYHYPKNIHVFQCLPWLSLLYSDYTFVLAWRLTSYCFCMNFDYMIRWSEMILIFSIYDFQKRLWWWRGFCYSCIFSSSHLISRLLNTFWWNWSNVNYHKIFARTRGREIRWEN